MRSIILNKRIGNVRLGKKNRWWIIFVVFIVLFSYYISNNWYGIMLIQGDSMVPTYHNMQLVILNKYNKEFLQGDVIAFECEELAAILVKRIVACPGDIVVINQGTLFINEQVSDIYSEKQSFNYPGLLEEPVYLQEGEYIVIGDNIPESKDSRYAQVGIVERKHIIGKVKNFA